MTTDTQRLCRELAWLERNLRLAIDDLQNHRGGELARLAPIEIGRLIEIAHQLEQLVGRLMAASMP